MTRRRDDCAEWAAKPELREAFKEAALTYCLYGDRAGAKGQSVAAHPLNTALAVRFPEQSDILALRLADYGDASDLAREMRRREAELVLGRVFPRTFTASDGRSGSFRFVSTGRRGTGTGNLGNDRVTFTFGMK